MKILARHLTADFYNCKNNKMTENATMLNTLRGLVGACGYQVLRTDSAVMEEGHACLVLLCKQGHITMHIYSKLLYVALDIFICDEQANPDMLFRAIKHFFKPDKVRTTFLKRGDFGSNRDARPKIKNRIAPVRRFRNTSFKVLRSTSSKVIRILAHKNS